MIVLAVLLNLQLSCSIWYHLAHRAVQGCGATLPYEIVSRMRDTPAEICRATLEYPESAESCIENAAKAAQLQEDAERIVVVRLRKQGKPVNCNLWVGTPPQSMCRHWRVQ